LNKSVGVFVRSFYKPILAPTCDERKLLAVGKTCTLVFGLIITTVAVVVSKFRTVGLFDLVNQLAASLTIPLALPLVFGFFHLKTPPWSAWSTAVIGLAVSLAVKFGVTAQFVQETMRWTKPLSPREAADAQLTATVLANLTVAGGWFFLTTLFYRSSSPEHQSRIKELSGRLQTPVATPSSNSSEDLIYRLIGRLSMTAGIFILLLIFIPNSFLGRMCFVFCGGTITLVGLVLLSVGQRRRNRLRVMPQASASLDQLT